MNHNYFSTFIAVAEDSSVEVAKCPKPRGDTKTVAQLHYEMLVERKFEMTQEEILFDVWMTRKGPEQASDDEVELLKTQFFDKGQPCLRTSPLAKTHGWGIVFDVEGRAGAVPVDSDEYVQAAQDGELAQLKAMRSKRKS